MALQSGITLRQYEIIEPLGAGGMGEVYRAHDAQLGRDVAIKVLPAHLAADADVRARFDREARAIASLSHPNLLTIHEFTVSGETPFAVMELLEGETLRRRLANGPIPWRTALEILEPVAEGLAAAHAKGIIHRDLKPDNIFLTSAGVVKILDFGLAARMTVESSPSTDVTVAQTMPGMVLGTIGYIAPEQLQGLPPDARSDLFSLGCTLFEMLTGSLPFNAQTIQETIASTLRDPVPALPSLVPPAPADLARVVERCLARSVERRFASARDLSLAVRGILQGSGPVPVTRGRRKTVRGKSIAVLPFENSTGAPETDYVADGLTESIINMLSQLPNLRVVPRTAVFRYKGVAVDPGAAALALNARALLTGRIAPRGDMLSIQAELVDAATESQIWGEQYRRPLDDLQALQEEIAWHISEALRLKLTPPQRKQLHKQRTASSEAYQEYLKGRFEWNKWTPDGFRKAAEHFQRSIDLDPKFALGWAGLGDAYGALAYYNFIAAREGFPRAETAAQQALALDAKLPEAHLTLALCRLFYDWNATEADAGLRRAIELQSSHPAAHAFYAFCLQAQGRDEEAVAEARQARALDPVALLPNLTLGWVLVRTVSLEEALAQARHTIALDPLYIEGHVVALTSLEQLGRYGDAARHFGGAMQCFGVDPDTAAAAQVRIDVSSKDSYWQTKLATLNDLARMHHIWPVFFVGAYVALGRAEEALDLLDGMFESRSGYLVFAKGDPVLAPLRSHPRFQSLIARIDLK
jgi:serine/threonine protein kinase/tetratricopeptide (TPR) repeat protein